MRHNLYILTLLSLVLACGTSCIYPYDADIEGTGNQMVIEGSILSGAPSVFTLSLTKPISDLNALTQSICAKSVVVESEDGTRYEGSLSCEKNAKYVNGEKFVYTANTENLSTSHRCRAVITASDGTVYTSEWVPFVSTPDIDSVFYQVNEDLSGLSVMVDTHAGTEDCRYYGWTFTEDWEFTAQLQALCYYDPSTNGIYNFQNGENTYFCWNHNDAPDINYFSTEKLSENIVSRHVVTRLAANTLKVQYIYSIEVRQRCVTLEEFNYWNVLQKNGEGTGDLFSAQPNEMKGNITSSNPAETVIGYIGAGEVKKERIFIDCREMHLYNVKTKYELEVLTIPSAWRFEYEQMLKRPYYYDYLAQGYCWTRMDCLDCRVFGTKNRPDFWPYKHK